MPALRGWHHISLSVTDLAASERWFVDVLGLKVLDRLQHEGWEAVITGDVAIRLALEAQHHAGNQGERFDPRRTGVDHLAFAAADRAELEEWQEHFARLGVDYTPIVSRDYGDVLTFRHPDGIQFELFVLSAAKAAEAGFAEAP